MRPDCYNPLVEGLHRSFDADLAGVVVGVEAPEVSELADIAIEGAISKSILYLERRPGRVRYVRVYVLNRTPTEGDDGWAMNSIVRLHRPARFVQVESLS